MTREVEVLVVGGGLVGLAGALFLARQGVDTVLADRHGGVSIHGRARGINHRTMEIYRAYGVADDVEAAGKPFADEAGVARCHTLAEPWEWLFEASEPMDWPELTAGRFVMADQNTVEPILVAAGRAAGVTYRFDTMAENLRETADGVTAELHDRATGAVETVHARYVVAADGTRSRIRQALGIRRPGETTLLHSLNVVFRAGIADLITRRALFWIITHPAVKGGFVSTSEPDRWQLTLSYDPTQTGPEDYTEDRCREIVAAALGRPQDDVRIEGVAPWQQGLGVAERYRQGRVFLAGDSAHVWPPAGALGANTGVQDAHNLAWKLAAVLEGRAATSLLDTYDVERRPLAEALAPAIVAHQQARATGAAEPTEDPRVPILGHRYGHPSAFVADVGAPATVGARAPHLTLPDGPLHDHLTGGPLLLVDTAGGEEEGRRAGVPVRRGDADPAWAARYGAGAHLLRPDGFVAWQGSGSASRDDLRRAVDAMYGWS